jgi:protein O-mannosyl-transferase
MTIKTFKYTNSRVLFCCLIISFVLYGNTLWNKYCLDDAIVITKNQFTKKGLSGISDIFKNETFTGFFGKQKQLISGARYRPLSLATFAIEQEYLGNSPAFSHFINILLFAFTAFLLFLIIVLTFKSYFPEVELFASLAVLLFLFHPIHTEVIANIKGRDEILALFFSLWAAYCLVKFKTDHKKYWVFIGSFLWLAALFSKENAIVFALIFPLFYYFLPDFKWKQLIFPAIIYAISAVIFISVRQYVIGGLYLSDSNELMNNPFLHTTFAQKSATILYTLGFYIKLLILPHPLTYDYYPYHIPVVNWFNVYVMVSLVLYVFLLVVSIYIFRKRNIISFSTLFYLIPIIPVSNIFFPVGAFMNERFIYFSSIGFCVLLGYFFYLGISKQKRVWLYSVLGGILLLYGIKTITRNTVWKNDYTLFIHDVNISKNSAKGNCAAGGVILDNLDTTGDKNIQEVEIARAIHYLRKAIEIHPVYMDAWVLLGNAYFKLNDYDSAQYYYSTVLKINPNFRTAITNMLAVAENISGADSKIKVYQEILNYDTTNYQIYYRLGQLFGKEKNDLNQALVYYKKAEIINPGAKEIYMDMGVIYGLLKDFKSSVEMLQKAQRIDPADANIVRNIGITYQLQGDMLNAGKYFQRADSMQKK